LDPLKISRYTMVKWNPETNLDPNNKGDWGAIYIIEQDPKPGVGFRPASGVILTFGSYADLQAYRNPTTTTTTDDTEPPTSSETTTTTTATTEPSDDNGD
jgi:hypothetical protein